MSRIRTLAPLIAGLLATTAATARPPNSGSVAQHQSICHAPPGNTAKARTLTVGAPAVAAHLRHGDARGACDAPAPDRPDEGGEPVPDERPDVGTDPVPDERQRRRRRAHRRR
jgi:hypothetical protein